MKNSINNAKIAFANYYFEKEVAGKFSFYELIKKEEFKDLKEKILSTKTPLEAKEIIKRFCKSRIIF